MVRQAHHDNWVVLFKSTTMDRIIFCPYILVTLVSLVLLVLLGCDAGGGSTDGDDPCNAPKGDRPTWCEANDNKDTNEPQINCGDGECQYTEGCGTCPDDCQCYDGANCDDNHCIELETCGDGVCDEKIEHCANCVSDCGCWKGEVCNDDFICVTDTSDPLLDYYWLEGTWQEVDFGQIVEVEIKLWDDELGAEVWGFDPAGKVYIKKNPQNEQFELSMTWDDGSWAKGEANLSTLIVKFTNHNGQTGSTYDVEYHKL